MRHPNRVLKAMAASVTLVVILTGVALAQGAVIDKLRTGNTVTVAAGETVSNDLYAFAGTVRVDGTVNGDLVASGGLVDVTGTVTGDVLAAGGSVTISGTVAGDARLAFRRSRPSSGRDVRSPIRTFATPAWLGPGLVLAALCAAVRCSQRGGPPARSRGPTSTAPNQPLPVFLLDHQCSDGTHELHFRVTNRTLRPGVLFRCRDAFHFFGVTVEDERLVLATYSRTKRRSACAVPKLGLGMHVMRVVVSGRRVTAGLWQAGGPPRTQLRASVTGSGSGAPGVLMVAPTNRRAASLLVSRYRLSSPYGFRVTSPKAAFLITGTPQSAAGQIIVGLRAASDIPASIQFEWSNDPKLRTGVQRSSVQQPRAPYTARTDIVLSDSQPVYWRARFVATHSGKAHHSAIQRYKPHGDNDRLVMAAASCAHLWGLNDYAGLQRVLEAAPVEPAMLVYQGDLGYAGNSRFSAYLQAPDFYAERFTRTLADPHFAALRRQVPVGFTADDHDYAQQNNAASDRFPRWSVPLWNEIHADPSNLGYNDWRFGDVHCLTLDGRRYADHVNAPERALENEAGHRSAGVAGYRRDHRCAPDRDLQRGHLRVAWHKHRLLDVRMAERIPPADDAVHVGAASRCACRYSQRRRSRPAHSSSSRPGRTCRSSGLLDRRVRLLRASAEIMVRPCQERPDVGPVEVRARQARPRHDRGRPTHRRTQPGNHAAGDQRRKGRPDQPVRTATPLVPPVR